MGLIIPYFNSRIFGKYNNYSNLALLYNKCGSFLGLVVLKGEATLMKPMYDSTQYISSTFSKHLCM